MASIEVIITVLFLFAGILRMISIIIIRIRTICNNEATETELA